MRITAGLMTSEYWCLLPCLLCFALDLPRDSPECTQRAKQGNGGPVVFAGQKPYPTWRHALPAPEDSVPDPVATAPVGADLKGVFAEARRSPVLPIVLGVSFVLATLIPVGLLIALMLRPASAPKVDAPLPALVALPPPLLDSASQTMKSDQLSSIEPPPIQFGASPEENLEATPSPGPTTIVRPPPLARDTAPPVILAPLPPRRPLESAPPARPLDRRRLLGLSSRRRLLGLWCCRPRPSSPGRPTTNGPQSMTSPRTLFICRAERTWKPIRVSATE